MRYSLACLSDTGVTREHNEDNFAFFGKVMPREHLTSVAYAADVAPHAVFAVGLFDGMGGEANGESASYVAAKAFDGEADRTCWTRESVLELFTVMESAVCAEREAQRAKTMGTTATIVAVDNDHAYVANVGDSPAMLYEGGALRVLSHEHTDAKTLQLLGITERKPGLTQFLGMSDGEVSPSPHITDFDIAPGTAILLASDGLTGPLDKETICSALASGGETVDKAKLLRDLAIKGGGADNITVLLCEAMELEPEEKDVNR